MGIFSKSKNPTKLKKMKLDSVDFVRRGANQEAYIALAKSYDDDYTTDEVIDVAKAEDTLTAFTDMLGTSFSTIMQDSTLSDAERVGMVAKSLAEFNDTMDDYMSSFGILEKSFSQTANNFRKGETETMANFTNVDKSLLSPEDVKILDVIMKKANATIEEDDDEIEVDFPPAAPKKKLPPKETEKKLPPEIEKALEEVEEMKKSYEMNALKEVAKKYEQPLGKKAEDVAKTLYDLKKSSQENYDSYVALLDEQVSLVEKSGTFAEIGKSGGYGFSSVRKSEPELKIETIAKSYMSQNPGMSYNDAVTKAWMDNPDLAAAYEEAYHQ